MIEDHQIICLYVMIILLILNLVILIRDGKVQYKILYAINALFVTFEIITYLLLRLLPFGWEAEYPYLSVIPFLWLGSIMGVSLLTYFDLWNFLDAHRQTKWGGIGLILLILAHIVFIAVGIFNLFGAFRSFIW